MYEIYVETCGQNAQNQVNPAMFGKLVRLVFPDLGTRRLGTRGSASGDIVAFEKSTNYNRILQEEGAVEDLLMSFWKSLQQDAVMLLSLPDVCQLLKCYDAQLYKGIEDILLHDFLEDVSIQYLKSVRLFSKKFKLWLLSALEGFPALLQISKFKDALFFAQFVQEITEGEAGEEIRSSVDPYSSFLHL
ncbi:hypothetical protein G4228_008193 [Cervus hanglu yarkandensis]|nr:hypothetical protein G4228_008193 [Cervus hanglu yarkandensis]